MGGFFQNIFHFFFLSGYIIIYIVSIIILKPFRIHKHRKYSTIALKMSYLIFLALFLVFTYMLLSGIEAPAHDDQPYESIFNIHLFLFLSTTLVPNVGIMLRKKIKKNRIRYNIILTCINLVYSFYLLFLTISGRWALL